LLWQRRIKSEESKLRGLKEANKRGLSRAHYHEHRDNQGAYPRRKARGAPQWNGGERRGDKEHPCRNKLMGEGELRT